MEKFHMKRQPQGIWSTKERVKTDFDQIYYKKYISPPIVKEKHNQLFFSLTLIDEKDDTIFVDLTRKFPLINVNGYTAIFILYYWTRNVIFTNSIKDAKDYTMVKLFTKNIEYLSSRGFKPEYNVMDNVASKSIRTYLTKEKIKFQLVKPHNHCANKSEWVIQTFKNHFIYGLCIGDKALPTTLWSYLVKQAQNSLKIMRISCI